MFPEPAFDTVTDADGRYRICGLPPGEYVVHAWAEGYLGEFYDDSPCWQDADPVMVAEDGEVLGIDFALSVGGSIRGRIHDGVAAVPGAIVNAWPADRDSVIIDPPDCRGHGNGAMAVADREGNYVLSGLESGHYVVLAEAPEFLPTFYGGGQDPEHATPVGVTAPHVTSGIDIALERGGAITGSVHDEATGAPIAGAQVEIYLAMDGGEEGPGGSSLPRPIVRARIASPAFRPVSTWCSPPPGTRDTSRSSIARRVIPKMLSRSPSFRLPKSAASTSLSADLGPWMAQSAAEWWRRKMARRSRAQW